MFKGVLTVQCAGLGLELLAMCPEFESLCGLRFAPLQPVFPAVTCTAQASFRSALPPSKHGVICNGRYERKSKRVEFWHQSADLVAGERIWEGLRRNSGTAAMMFYQQSLGENCDFLLSPAPIHRHHGGMIQACHSRPAELENELNSAIGKSFDLQYYWGPRAGRRSSQWICQAIKLLMSRHRPNFIAAYLPHMDYCQQKYGPECRRRIYPELLLLASWLKQLREHCEELGYELLVWGDYAITPVRQALFPNRLLRRQGYFEARKVPSGRSYPNLYDSAAFAMCDHQVAHVYIQNPADLAALQKLFQAQPGIARALPPQHFELPGPESGDLVLEAEPGYWFAYQWWEKNSEAPDYAAHVDIHNKIGFDPCELFWKIPFVSIHSDCSLPRGSHGRCDQAAAYAASPALAEQTQAHNLLELSAKVKDVLNRI